MPDIELIAACRAALDLMALYGLDMHSQYTRLLAATDAAAWRVISEPAPAEVKS